LKYKRVEHVAMAVNNLDEVREIFENKLGLKLDYIESFPQYGTRMAMYPVGETCLEVLEGVSTSDPAKWIAQHGQSLYHICLEVEDIDAAMSELRAKGADFQTEKPMVGHGNCRIVFIDPKSTGGLVIELVEMPKQAHGHQRAAE